MGEQHLGTFQDNEKTIPTILTTSQKLSTGVDACNVRNIVFLRPVNSMIEFKQIIDAEQLDLFDVLAYITFALSPITRLRRVEQHRNRVLSNYDEKLQAFIDFVLAQYVKEDVDELDQAKLSTLLKLKYNAINEATGQLGDIAKVRDALIGFQRYLY